MKYFIAFVLALALTACTDAESSQSQGSGGGKGDQVSRPDLSPIPYESEDYMCYLLVPPGFDPEDCIDDSAPLQSGYQSVICGDIPFDLFCTEK